MMTRNAKASLSGRTGPRTAITSRPSVCTGSRSQWPLRRHCLRHAKILGFVVPRTRYVAVRTDSPLTRTKPSAWVCDHTQHTIHTYNIYSHTHTHTHTRASVCVCFSQRMQLPERLAQNRRPMYESCNGGLTANNYQRVDVKPSLKPLTITPYETRTPEDVKKLITVKKRIPQTCPQGALMRTYTIQ